MLEFINYPACCSKQYSLVKVKLKPFLGTPWRHTGERRYSSTW